MVLAKNEKTVKDLAELFTPPFDKGIRCAFRGKERGDGIILDDAKLREYDGEFKTLASQVNHQANKKALDEIFGQNHSYKSIYDYAESQIPEKSPQFNDQATKIRELHTTFIPEATTKIRFKNDQHQLFPNQKRRVPETSPDFQREIKKMAHDLAMTKVLGANPYKNFSEFLIRNNPRKYAGYDEKKKYRPADYEQKEKRYEELERKYRQELKEKLLDTDPSLKEKSLCLNIASQVHVEEGRSFGSGKIPLMFTVLYQDHGFSPHSFTGISKELPLLGESIMETIKNGYPDLNVVPSVDYKETVGGILSIHRSRTELKRQNETKKQYFTPEAVFKALKAKQQTVDATPLPEGWYALSDTDALIVATQPLVSKYGIGLPSIEKFMPSIQENPTLMPHLIAKKTNNKWKVSGYNTLDTLDQTVSTKQEAIKHLNCFAEGYEKAFDDIISPFITKWKDKHDDKIPTQTDLEPILSNAKKHMKSNMDVCLRK